MTEADLARDSTRHVNISETGGTKHIPFSRNQRCTPMAKQDPFLTRRGFTAGLAAALSLPPCASRALAEESAGLREAVEAARAAHDLPAMTVLIGRNGAVIGEAVSGVRARGAPIRARLSDRWHIGSCTKAMTATLLARYAERGLAGLDTPLSDLLPDIAATMHNDSRRITLAHLLTMTAGLPENPSHAEDEAQVVADIMAITREAPTPQAQRRLVTRRMLARAPLTPPGAAFSYSNSGYIIAGAVAEQIGGAPFEQLLGREVLAPLGITEFGFGAPGSNASLDHPRGHEESSADKPVAPESVDADNPPFMAPAGGLNIRMRDWARFASEHLRGERGKGLLLKGESYARLHNPALEGGIYAFGWGVLVREGRRLLLTHNGGNGLWFADIRIFPQTGYIFLMATNDGRESTAKKAFAAVRAMLTAKYQPM